MRAFIDPQPYLRHALLKTPPLGFRCVYVLVVTFVFTSPGVLPGLGSHLAAGEPTELSANDAEFFEDKIRPLLIEHCYECHAGEERAGGLSLEFAGGLQIGGDSGPAISLDNPDESLLLKAISYDGLDLQMPPSGKLSPDAIRSFEQWVRQGAKDPRTLPTSMRNDSGTSKAAGTDDKVAANHWSFQPVERPDIPEVVNQRWVKTPIDAFVLARMEQEGVTPAPSASRMDWIRRVCFDLTGLPPSLQGIESFVEDASPSAEQKLIDRLMQSPHYGERWGRHWLDVARYADSNGLDENLAFGNAWRYRDYVISAFNQDLPFDQFVVEQLAGDLLPRSDRESKIATGFLALGARVLAEPDREKLVMDTIDEQIDTVGKAFLGLTLGCARCHDHKFDPISQADYYALAAIFMGTESFAGSNTGAIKHWYEHSFASDDELDALKSVDAAIAKKNRAAAEFKSKTMRQIRESAVRAAPQYFAAASLVRPDSPPNELATVAQQFGLHARILHHSLLHLQNRPEDPIVMAWHAVANRSSDEIANYFEAALAVNEESKEPAVPLELANQLRKSLADQAGLIAVPPQPEHAFDDEQLRIYYSLMEEARELESRSPDATAAMGVVDGTVCDAIAIHIRGDHRNLGRQISREFPVALRQSQTRPIFPSNESGRAELARWITSTRNPLTARVYVNRVWRWHFGKALVSTTENFGLLGNAPTHEALLDWLAYYFMENGWSTKALHRLILQSSTYRISSFHNDEAANLKIDPENKLLWRFPKRRLEAEEIRDAILSVSGCLDSEFGGKMVPLRNRQFVFNHTSVDHTKYDSHRRAAYLPVIRNNLYELFTQFDFPDPTMPTGNRATTTVAPQALLLLNAPLILDAAEQLAANSGQLHLEMEGRISWLYRHVLGRPAAADEIARNMAFLHPETAQPTEVAEARWILLCHALLVSNEFLYVH